MLNGTVISYGNYDKASERLFGGIGDGVLFKADFDKYINFCVYHDLQMVFDFGIKLSENSLQKSEKA